jgi:CRISPR-associated autoregulator DevR family
MTNNNEKISVYSISISGKVSWQLHALNNEGNEGNQTLTRRYYIVEQDDSELKYVNGLSGDMLKHIQAEHLYHIAMDDKLKLSEGGKRFDPDRINYDLAEDIVKLIKKNIELTKAEEELEKARAKKDESAIEIANNKLDQIQMQIENAPSEIERLNQEIESAKQKKEQTIDEEELKKLEDKLKKQQDLLKEELSLKESNNEVIKICALSDLEGYMVTEKGSNSLKKDSVIEFGTVVGIPSKVKTQNYFHAKYKPGESPVPYNTQVSSGLYATVLNIEAFRIGYNQLTLDYAIDKEERKKRLDALLKSVLYTYLQPNGAKRNSNLPHIDHFEGVITFSTSPCPSPMISSLNENYREQTKAIAKSLNTMNKKDNQQDVIQIKTFDSMAEFAEKIQKLIENIQPWGSKDDKEEGGSKNDEEETTAN